MERNSYQSFGQNVKEINQQAFDDRAETQTATWHDVQMIDTEDGSQELIIENLENLKATTALIVTRSGNSFKIGITSDEAARSLSLQPVDGQ
jgi:hypothetical protein